MKNNRLVLLFLILAVACLCFCACHQVNTVTFFTNGGNYFEPFVVENGTQVVLPVPEKEGFTFEGWFTNEDVTGEPVSSALTVEEDIELFAKWKIVYVTIDFVTNVENVSLVALQFALGSDVEKLPVLVRDGYSFAGWFDNEELEGDAVETIVNVTEDATLYAKWKQNEVIDPVVYVTLRFVTNVENVSLEELQYVYGSNVEKLPSLVRDGYSFAGWFDNAELQGSELKTIVNLTEDVVLYAKWLKIVSYQVNHSLQNVQGDSYSLFYTETLYGAETLDTKAEAKNFEGFIAQNFSQTKILSDGSVVVNVLYNRRECQLSVKIHGVEVAKETLRFGAAVDLSAYSLIGHEVLGWYINGSTELSAANSLCIVNENLNCVAKESFVEITSQNQLIEFVENNVEQLIIGEDITISQTIYVTCDTLLFSTNDVKLTRSPNFDGDMFVVGQDKNGQNTQLVPRHSSLTIMPTKSSTDGDFNTVTIDGNKDAMKIDVNGSAIFVANGAELNIYDGTVITGCKKSGNVLTQEWQQGFTSPDTVGGAAILLSSSEMNMYGGEISNCETASNLYGGAIYNFGILSLSGGIIEGNKASLGGAIYSASYVYVYGGTFANNSATEHGGAIYCENTRYTSTTLYVSNFVNNTAKRGGAIFFSMDSGLTIYQNVGEDRTPEYANIFDGNVATEFGGAIYSSGSFNCFGGYFKNNSAAYGSAIFHFHAGGVPRIFTLRDTKFENNVASEQGTVYVGNNGAFVEGQNEFENNYVGSGEDLTVSITIPQ